MKQAFAPQLIALSEGDNIPLDKPIVLVGRHQECDVQIPSRKISRRHCCIALVNDHLVVRDLGSTNGIRINGVKVLEGNLQLDDELTIGNLRYQVKMFPPVDQTVKEPPRNAIKAASPARAFDHNQSYDEPIPLADDGVPLPAFNPAPRPATNGAGSYSLNVPDDIELLPLEPPKP